MHEFEKNFREEEKEITVCRSLSGVRAETFADMILPDYMGDIKRLLSYRATVMPLGNYDSEGEVRHSGTVEYKVLYLDGEGELTEAVFSSDYEYPIKTSDSYIASMDTPEITGLTVRAAGPRKLCAKATVLSDILVKQSMGNLCPELPDGAVVKKTVISPFTFEALPSVEREFAEEVKIDGVCAEEIDVVSTGADVCFEDVKSGSDKVNLSGVIEAYAILRLGGSTLTRAECKMKFDIETELCDREGAVFPSGYITSMKTVANNDVSDSGESCASLVFSVIGEFGGALYRNDEITLIQDAYIPGCRCDASYGKTEYMESALCGVRENWMSFEADRTDGKEERISEIIAVEPSLKITSERVESDTVTTEGEIDFLLLGVGGELGELKAVRITKPFEISEKLQNGAAAPQRKTIRRRIVSPTARMDSGKIYFKCNLISEYRLLSPCEARTLAGLENPENCKADECVIKVYYPEKSDTLWSVAKKYGVTPEKLGRDNGIDVSAASVGGEVFVSEFERLVIFDE